MKKTYFYEEEKRLRSYASNAKQSSEVVSKTLVFFPPPHWIAAVAARLRNDRFAVSMAIDIVLLGTSHTAKTGLLHCVRNDRVHK